MKTFFVATDADFEDPPLTPELAASLIENFLNAKYPVVDFDAAIPEGLGAALGPSGEAMVSVNASDALDDYRGLKLAVLVPDGVTIEMLAEVLNGVVSPVKALGVKVEVVK